MSFCVASDIGLVFPGAPSGQSLIAMGSAACAKVTKAKKVKIESNFIKNKLVEKGDKSERIRSMLCLSTQELDARY
jgi:hypothetical protein